MTQNCQKCGCPINWDKLIEKVYKKKDGSMGSGWWREDLSKEEHTKERCETMSITNEWRQSKEAPKQEKTDYGQVPEWLNDQAENIKIAWKGYASLAASLVDEVQPTLDNRTRSMAVSAVIDQIIQMQKIKAIKELRSEKLE